MESRASGIEAIREAIHTGQKSNRKLIAQAAFVRVEKDAQLGANLRALMEHASRNAGKSFGAAAIEIAVSGNGENWQIWVEGQSVTGVVANIDSVVTIAAETVTGGQRP